MGVPEQLNRDAAARLQQAGTFVEVGRVICTVTRELGVDECIVVAYADGRPELTIDNANLADEQRLDYLLEAWVHDPALRELLRFHAPVIEHEGLLLPIVNGPGQLLGSIRCRRLQLTTELRRDLTTLASYASAHCAKLGFENTPDPVQAKLTRRQHDVAQLAARWRTYPEIATSLGISENTVKKHLKDVFSRLSIKGRHELAKLMRHELLSKPEPGFTRDGDIVITRG